jgi:hypothetical protein
MQTITGIVLLVELELYIIFSVFVISEELRKLVKCTAQDAPTHKQADVSSVRGKTSMVL